MLHKMKLRKEPFEQMAMGTKTVEMRLDDEKRRLIKTGDLIEFSLYDEPDKKIVTRVTALHRFSSFSELYQAFPKEKLGYSADAEASPKDLEQFYPKEEQENSGVVGIELRLTDLQKFVDAQDNGYDFGETYAVALDEIRNGKKEEHWIWYVLPQIKGLGKSGLTAYFSIKDIQEAEDYYAHPVLRERLEEIVSELLKLETDDPVSILGRMDAFKLRSCMTLFRQVAPENELFQKVLDKYCMGIEDDRTLGILDEQKREA